MKVWIVMGTDAPEYGDSSWIAAVFSSKDLADKYCEVNNQLDSESYSYYVREEVVKDTYDMNTTVKDYYSYFISKEPEKPLEDLWFEYQEIKDWLHLKGVDIDLTEVEKTDNTDVYGYKKHTNSFKYIRDNVSSEIIKELEEVFNSPEYVNCNDDEPEKRIYDKDLYIEEDEDHINVFSVNSYEEARTVAFDLYNKWKKENKT